MNIKDRATVSSRVPEIDTLYVYKTNHTAKFTHRLQLGEGYRYVMSKMISYAEEAEIHIYHQTFEIDGITNGITMVTRDSNKANVKKFFKESIEQVKLDSDLKSKFRLAKYSPSQLGIKYLYTK